MRETTAIDRLADAYTQADAALFPTGATAMGIPGYDHLMDDYSPATYEKSANLIRETLAALAKTEPVDEVDRVTVAAMRDRLGLTLELHEAREFTADLNVIASPAQVRDVFDLMPTATRTDWENIASRAAALPDAFASYISSLREGMASGLMPAKLQVREVATQCETLGDPASSFFTSFFADVRIDGEPVEASFAAELAHAASEATRGHRELAAFLRDDLLPAAPAEDACGRERYERFSRVFVGARVDLDETYAWGLEELSRITAEQEALAEQIAGTGASVADAVAALDADPTRKLHGTDALQAWMQETSDAAIRDLDGVHFDISDRMRTLECRIAPTQSGGIYYTGPTDDFSRPGRMWWSVPAGVTEFDTWREKTTVYHEGVPGHHLQVARAVENSGQLNQWRRLACWMSGHGEGWALYAERLMEEFGYLDDPGDRFGMLDGQRLRATRVVLDLGVHLRKDAPAEYGAGTWNYDSAWRLLKANVNMDENFLRFELHRYLGWPGQAPSYKIGQRIWEQIRADADAAARARGEEFSLKDFHTRALNLGSVPLDVLREQLVP